ncbi:hypothetical protein [Pedobacter nutrimenti]|uniref:esterase/lipase family protein n=1 Tax=Pedobacter nutrimenti TaxID=1241337 RepID=UPI00292E3C20|nr:hypothetical protein [Pedobacter nutrimenti]
MGYLITLIHGTFAKKAPWTDENSDFCTKIKQQLGEKSGSIQFECFDWSGINSNTARFEEGDNLAIKLNAQLLQHPDKKKIIIAHSHGGNIAMYALKKIGASNKEFRLVTMATPFLNFRIREYAENINLHLILLCILICTLLLIPLGVLTDGFVRLSIFDAIDKYRILVFFFIVICLFGLLFRLGEYIYGFLNNKVDKLPEQLGQVIKDRSIENLKFNFSILAVVDHSDEIKLWFGNLYRIWETVLNIHEWLANLTRWAIYITLAMIFLMLIVLCIGVKSGSGVDSIFEMGYTFISYALFLLVFGVPILTFLIPCLFFLIKSNPLVLGWEPWKSQIFLRTTPSTTPLGYRNLTFIEYDLKRSHSLSLKHSIYEHEVVINDVCKWIVSLDSL